MKRKNYRQFAINTAISFCIMYAVMFLNIDNLDHIYLSLTRTYMALLMISPMAVLMLVTMPGMYNNSRNNRIITLCAVTVFSASLTFLRNQTFVDEKSYMKAMISHHSSAILTSKNARLADPDVKKLADSIIVSQQREIKEMIDLLNK